MHASVLAWVSQQSIVHDLASRSTLEVGSMNVNGTIRQFFTGPYLGVDMRPGPGVDQVANANKLPFGNQTFDVVVSTEMLEHDGLPWKSVAEMRRVLKKGGTLLLTARGYDARGCFGLHDHPGDYHRFSVGGIEILLDEVGFKEHKVIPDPEFPGFFAIARR